MSLRRQTSSVLSMFSRHKKQLFSHTHTTIARNDFEAKWQKQPKSQQEEKLKKVEFEIQMVEKLLNIDAPDDVIQARWEAQLEKLQAKQAFLLTVLGKTPAAKRMAFEERYAKAPRAKQEEKLKAIHKEILKLEILLDAGPEAQPDGAVDHWELLLAKLVEREAFLRHILGLEPADHSARIHWAVIDWAVMREKWKDRTDDQLKTKLEQVRVNIGTYQAKVESGRGEERDHYAAKLQKAELKRTFLQGKMTTKAVEILPNAPEDLAQASTLSAAIDGLADLSLGDSAELEAVAQTPPATEPTTPTTASVEYQPRLFGGSLFDHVSALYDNYGSKNTAELTQIRDRAVQNLAKYRQAAASSSDGDEAAMEAQVGKMRQALLSRAFIEGQLAQRL